MIQMEKDTIKQSLLLWLIHYERLQEEPRNSTMKTALSKLERTLADVDIRRIEMFHKTNDYYTLKYKHKGMERIMQFAVDEVNL